MFLILNSGAYTYNVMLNGKTIKRESNYWEIDLFSCISYILKRRFKFKLNLRFIFSERDRIFPSPLV